jgi:predicted phosphoribosyltransferase
MTERFEDRIDAGDRLAHALRPAFGGARGVVLGLPRGGVPVAQVVARELGMPLDVFIVRKLGVPTHEELAFGALASGDVRVVSRDTVAAYRLTDDEIAEVVAREEHELARRERRYRHGRPALALTVDVVIVVDDGLATGATMHAALVALRRMTEARLIVAVPVAPAETVQRLREEADNLICLRSPSPFLGVGRWYADFAPTSDEDVIAALDARVPPSARRGGAAAPHAVP